MRLALGLPSEMLIIYVNCGDKNPLVKRLLYGVYPITFKIAVRFLSSSSRQGIQDIDLLNKYVISKWIAH